MIQHSLKGTIAAHIWLVQPYPQCQKGSFMSRLSGKQTTKAKYKNKPPDLFYTGFLARAFCFKMSNINYLFYLLWMFVLHYMYACMYLRNWEKWPLDPCKEKRKTCGTQVSPTLIDQSHFLGTELDLKLAMEALIREYIEYLHVIRFPGLSFMCKLVPVQYQWCECGQLEEELHATYVASTDLIRLN